MYVYKCNALEDTGLYIYCSTSHDTPPQIQRVESLSSLGGPQNHNQSKCDASQDGLKRTPHTYPISVGNKKCILDNWSCSSVSSETDLTFCPVGTLEDG